MAPSIVLLLLAASFFIPTQTQLLSTEQSFTSVVLSQQGLDFLKNLLVTKAISSIIPLELPRIEKSTKIPFGSIDAVISNITIHGIDVDSSYIKLGETGIAIIASGATCDLSMNWYYSYSTWLLPVLVSDEGSASIRVWLQIYLFSPNVAVFNSF